MCCARLSQTESWCRRRLATESRGQLSRLPSTRRAGASFPFACLEMIRRRNQTARVLWVFKHVGYFDKVIGKPLEVCAPALDDLLSSVNLISVRIDESVIIAHQRAEPSTSCALMRSMDASTISFAVIGTMALSGGLSVCKWFPTQMSCDSTS